MASLNLNSMKAGTIQKILLLLIVLVTLAKLSLAGKGFLTFPDESRYLKSGEILVSLAHGDAREAAANIFRTDGRPGEAIIKIIPAGLQYASAELHGLETYESQNSYPLFLFNFLVYVLILLVHYRIAKLLLTDKALALFSVLMYCCLANSYIYLRHTLPYDCSLLVLSYVLYQVLQATTYNRFTYTKMFVMGFVAFYGYLCYPGYFPLFIIIFLMLVLHKVQRGTITTRIKHGSVYVMGSVACLALFELTAYYGGTSYIADSIALSKTITQGSFEESYSFLFKYLYRVEGVGGLILIAGLALFVFRLARIVINKRHQLQSIHYLFLFTALLFLLYASAGYFFNKMIFYGRLLHQFIPVLTLISAFVLGSVNSTLRYRQPVIAVLSAIFIINFSFIFYNYHCYSYPRDLAWQATKDFPDYTIDEMCEYENGNTQLVYVKEKHNPKAAGKGTLVISNGCFYYPFTGVKVQDTVPAGKIIREEPYFQNFEGYLFEGASIEQREAYGKAGLTIKVIKKG
jgi:hypothetical protein